MDCHKIYPNTTINSKMNNTSTTASSTNTSSSSTVHLPFFYFSFILMNFYFVMFYIASSFPNRGNSNLQRYRDWSWLNCRRKLAYNFSLRTWKEVTQAKFASGYEDGFRWCYVRSCVVALANLLATRFSATTMEKRCFGTAGGVFPLDRSHFLAGVLNFCSVYILWKI